MLILEGPDMVGKTTLAHQILKRSWCRDFGLVYKHFSKTPPGFNHLHDYWRNAVRRSVQDRFHLSNVAYRAACGEEQNTWPEEYRLVDGLLRLHGAFTVVITADHKLLRERFAQHAPREMYQLETVLKVNDWFYEAAINLEWSDEEHHDWRFDIDHHIHCTVDNPWPELPDGVFQRYANRQNLVCREGLAD